MTNNTLKFPTGDFTHTELAQANGKTNQQVWVAYQQAIKDGVIVSAGTRSKGKGKPSKLWKVADGQPVPVVSPAPVVPPVVPTPAVVKIVPVQSNIPVPPPEPVVKLEKIQPSAPPPTLVVETVEVAKVVPEIPVQMVQNIVKDVATLEQVCPICKNPLYSINDATGVMVWCSQPINICPSTENPSGHGRNVKDAYEVLCEKFRHLISHAKA